MKQKMRTAQAGTLSDILENAVFWSAMLYFSTFSIWPVEVRGVFYGIFCLWILLNLWRHVHYRHVRVWHILLVIYTAYVILDSFILYERTDRFFIGLYEYLFFPGLGIICWNQVHQNGFVKCCKIISYVSIMVSIIAISEFFLGINFFSKNEVLIWTNDGLTVNRSMAFSTSPMTLGTSLGIYIFSSFLLLIKTKKLRYAFIVMLNLSAMLATYSRGPLVSLLLAVLLLCPIIKFKSKCHKSETTFKKVLAIVLCVFAMAYFGGNDINEIIGERIYSIVDWDDDIGNLGRISAWIYSLDIIFLNPVTFLVGIGPASTGAYGLGESSLFVTESGFLKRFVEGGLFMVLSWYVLLLYIVRRSIKRLWVNGGISYETVCALGGVLSILIEDFVLQVTEDIAVSFYLWLFLTYLYFHSTRQVDFNR